MTSGLVNASFRLPEWQAVKMIFFAPCYFKHHCESYHFPYLLFLECWPFQIIQNFRDSSRSGAIFIFNKTRRSSLHALNVLYLFLSVRVPCTRSLLKLWSNLSKIGLLFKFARHLGYNDISFLPF